ncbi:PAS domain S-box protein [bacterium]|nr:PAS domain S-box protein [bacterium]
MQTTPGTNLQLEHIGLAFDHSPIASVIVRIDGIIQYANHAFARALQIGNPDVLTGRSLQSLALGENASDAVLIHLQSAQPVDSLSIRFRFGHGDSVTGTLSLTPLSAEADNERLTLCHFTLSDGGATRGASAALLSLYHALPMPVIAFDRDGMIRIWNRALEEVSGFPASEMIGRPDALLKLFREKAHVERARAILRRGLERCEGWQWRMHTASGEQVSINWTCAPDYRPMPEWSLWGFGEVMEEEEPDKEKPAIGSQPSEHLHILVPPALLEILPQPVFVKDNQDRFFDCNQKFEQLIQKSRSEIIDRHNHEVFDSRFSKELTEHNEEVLSGEPRTAQYEILSGDVIRSVIVHKKPLFDENGRILGILGAIEEITPSGHGVEMETVHSQLLETILESLSHPFFIVDAESHEILMANRTARNHLGKERHCFALHGADHPCDSVEHPCPLSEVRQTGKPATMLHIHYDAAGNKRYVEVHGYPILGDAGAVERMLEYSIDVTERVQTEEYIQRLAAAVDQAAEAIVITDVEGVIQYVNPAFEAITGYTSEEAVGNNPRMFKSGRHDRAYYDDLWSTLLSGKVWHGRFINRRKDGREYREDASISPIVDQDGAITHFVAVKRDVTREDALERQLRQTQRMESISMLASGIAHDFNNMLAGIMGNIEYIQYKLPPNHPLQENAGTISHTVDRASDLTRHLLTFSRETESSRRPMNLNSAVRDALKLLQRSIRKDIEIRINLNEDLPAVSADGTQMQQIIMNLCSNAADAISGAGDITIETDIVELDEALTSIHDTKPGPYVELSVSDNGLGISKEEQERIFEPFFTTKAPGKGTGLGLATCYGITQAHNGIIQVESELGVGTTFYIYLPLDKGEAVEIRKEIHQTRPTGSDATIMLVDDDDTFRYASAQYLRELGYQVLEASNGIEALGQFLVHHETIDLVVLDMIMPKQAGLETYRRMKELQPSVPVLVTSGFSRKGEVETALHEGAEAFIPKPFTFSEFGRIIKETLAHEIEE